MKAKLITIHLTHPVNDNYQYQLNDAIFDDEDNERIVITVNEGDSKISHWFYKEYIISIEILEYENESTLGSADDVI